MYPFGSLFLENPNTSPQWEASGPVFQGKDRSCLKFCDSVHCPFLLSFLQNDGRAYTRKTFSDHCSLTSRKLRASLPRVTNQFSWTENALWYSLASILVPWMRPCIRWSYCSNITIWFKGLVERQREMLLIHDIGWTGEHICHEHISYPPKSGCIIWIY